MKVTTLRSGEDSHRWPLLLPGSKIRWEVHMFAIGQEMKDQQVELAIYFYPKGVVPQHRPGPQVAGRHA